MRIGLTGGVGAGKSTVAAMLGEWGAIVLDADAIAREVVEPGTPGLAAVIERFGAGVLAADGTLDRAALAARVFADEDERAALNAIVHPLVGERTVAVLAEVAPDAVVVQDIPLLVENGLAPAFDAVLVVEAPLALRLARLAARGMPEADALARMARQADDAQRRAVADEVIVNDGGIEELRGRVEEVWSRLVRAERG